MEGMSVEKDFKNLKEAKDGFIKQYKEFDIEGITNKEVGGLLILITTDGNKERGIMSGFGGIAEQLVCNIHAKGVITKHLKIINEKIKRSRGGLDE